MRRNFQRTRPDFLLRRKSRLPPLSRNSVSAVTLTVSDGSSSTSCSTSVRVLRCPVPNNPPICDAGGPYTAPCGGPTTSVRLDGTGSSDPDTLDALTFSWSINCPGASFDNPTSPTPVLTLDTPCCSASCTVTLVVSDGQASSTCTATVNVTGGGSSGGSLTL